MGKNKKKHTAKRLFFTLASVLSLGLLSGLAAAGFLAHLNSPPQGVEAAGRGEFYGGYAAHGNPAGIRGRPGGGFYVEVRPGESSQSVGRRLEEAGLIRSRLFWDLAARARGDFVRAGTYLIEGQMSQLEIRSVLVSGRQVLVRVTIPEGSTVRRAGIILEEAGVTAASGFIEAASDPALLEYFNIPNASFEGFLFPDTYLFEPGYPAERIVRAMAENFFSRLYGEFPQARLLSREELNRAVIIASIVEREHRVPSEAAVMAGVFFNRLDIGMPLQSCATVEYVITEILGRPHPPRLFYRDLEIVSPFNTYLVRGLPPAPISAPGLTSLNAAFNPQASDYLFFRLINASVGNHHFSRTFDEHSRAGGLIAAGRL